MVNELKELTDRLEGYGKVKFIVIEARKNEDGRWTLVVEAVTDDNNK